MIQNSFRMSWSLAILWCCAMAWGQCEADHNVIVTNFEFTPSSLTVVPGETVAFINIEPLCMPFEVDFTVGRRAGVWTVESTGGRQAWFPGSD